jgi:L-ribulose-5-phosphate 4-epimerase
LPGDAAHAAVIVEELAALAFQTLSINPDAVPICDALRDKHHLRKHGDRAYYGQPKGKVRGGRPAH